MNIQKLRQDTPSSSKYIHFNNAGSALPPKQVVEKVTDYLQEESQLGGYEIAEKYAGELAEIYPTLASFINAEPSEVAIMQSATDAWNAVFYAIDWQKGDTILTSFVEYSSNFLSYLHLSKSRGVELKVLPCDSFGQIDLEALEKAIDKSTKAICMTHIPSNGGLVNPAEEVGKIAKKYNILFLLDACQSVGQMPIDVKGLDCDMLSATGRKYLRGPRGTGFLYIRENLLQKLHPKSLDTFSAEWLDRNSYVLREDARRFEAWERNYALHLGLAEAIKYAQNLGMKNIWERIQDLGQKLRNKLEQIPGVQVQDLGKVKGGIVSFTIENQKAKFVKEKLFEQNIHLTAVPKSSALLDIEARNIPELLRASVHCYNTESETERFCEEIQKYSIP